METKFYLCAVVFQNPTGFFTTYQTFAFASSAHEANEIAKAQTRTLLPADTEIVSATAIAVKREVLEEVAERVLGWKRP